jgi:cell division protein FtsI (penicillin-binding protein 3)
MKRTLILISIIIPFASCNIKNNSVNRISTIDSTLQVKIDSILQNRLSELNATSGQVIVMEVRTGEIKASVGTELTPQESGLVRTASLLAALETKAIQISDTVDVGNGILTIGKDTLLDHNWYRGGYGKITIQQGFGLSSNIANYKTAKHTFKDAQAFAKALAKYGYQVKDTSLIYNPSGYGVFTTPLQNLTFYNAIAQGTISDKATANSIKLALEYTVTNGLAKPAMSDKVKIAGATGTIQLPNGEYAVEFCGYFPADNPQYSVIVSINKKDKPASGGLMAGTVFKQIAELMMEEECADVESLEFWTADTILKANRELVALISPLYQYVNTDSLSSFSFENDLKWMNEYRKRLCKYYNTNKLGTDTISQYAKADTVIEASRKLWELDSDDSTMGMNVRNGAEYTRLVFQQFNEYAQLLDICKTKQQRKLLKDEITAWYELEELLSKAYTDCTYLKYWGGSCASSASSAGMLKILESHITLYRRDKSILKNDFETWNNQGIYLECVKELPVNCFLIKLKESIYEEENGNDYAELLKTTKKDISELSSRINKWITAHQAWIKETEEYNSEDISEKYLGNVLVELSCIISSI